MNRYRSLSIGDPADLRFGVAPKTDFIGEMMGAVDTTKLGTAVYEVG